MTNDKMKRLVVPLVLTLLVGCSNQGGLKLAKVTGTVRLDGAPVEGAGLEFISDAGGVAYGRSNAAGEYYMSFGSSSTGAVVGRNLVRITASDKVTVGGRKYESTEIFPKKYNANSELYVNVEPGSNRFDFDCESAGFKGQATTSSGGN